MLIIVQYIVVNSYERVRTFTRFFYQLYKIRDYFIENNKAIIAMQNQLIIHVILNENYISKIS
jgi:hypothetical protein